MEFLMPDYVREVLSRLKSGGFSAYLVGGCVRDTLLGRPVHDWDVATAARPEDTERLFERTAPTGARYGTVTALCGEHSVEVTTFRRDGAYTNSRSPESVDFIAELAGDLARRDFTVNAMAVSEDGALTDPFGGRADLRSGVLRAVGDPEARFTEDALRILRAYRFSAQLGFVIEERTLAAAKKLAHLTGALSRERVRDEIEKILLSPRPELAGELVGADASSLAALPCDRLSRWAALCAKMPFPEAFLRGLRLDNETIRACVSGVRCAEPWDMLAAKRAVAAYGERAARCAEAINGRALGLVDEILESGACCTLKQLAVTGEDLLALGFPPDRTLGARLARLLDYVIENPAENDREKLLALAQNEL